MKQEDVTELLAMLNERRQQMRRAGDQMFWSLARLADRTTLSLPKYAADAMKSWAAATGQEMPTQEVVVKIVDDKDEDVRFPSANEDVL